MLRCDDEYDFETSLLLKNIVLWSATDNNHNQLLYSGTDSFLSELLMLNLHFSFTFNTRHFTSGVTVLNWFVHWTCDQELAVQLPANQLSCKDAWQVVYTYASVTKQYNLVLPTGWWCSVAGKVTTGLAFQWPCVTDSVVYPSTGSMV